MGGMSDYLDPNNEELLKDFFSEAQMQVDTLEQNILVLENETGNRDAVDEIFRAAHTLKGGSATVEMMELSHFTHIVEDVLDEIRGDRLAVNEDVVDTLLSAIDVIKAMLEKRMEGAVYEEDTSAIEAALKALLPDKAGGKKGGKGKAAKPASVPAVAPVSPPVNVPAASGGSGGAAGTLTAQEVQELREAADAGMPIYRVSVKMDKNGLMNTVGGIQVYASMKGVGSILRTVPEFEQLYEDVFFPVVDYYVATKKTPDELLKYVVIPDVSLSADIAEIGGGAGVGQAAVPAEVPVPASPETAVPAVAETTETTAPAGHEEDTHAAPAKPAPPAKAAADAAKAGKEAGSILRVDSKRIDDLLNLVSETVITKATFNQISNQFGDLLTGLHTIQSAYREQIKSLFDSMPGYLESIEEGKSVKEIRKEIGENYGGLFTLFDPYEAELKSNVVKFRSTSQNLGRITGELQEGVMRIRMVPISQIFSRFPRLVRDLSKSLSKKINLVIEGEETELDKSVIEDLLDPNVKTAVQNFEKQIRTPPDMLPKAIRRQS